MQEASRSALESHPCPARRRDEQIIQTTEKVRVWCLQRVLDPMLSRLFGYMPARRLGLSEDLPAPVLLQWGHGSAVRHYFYDDPGRGAPSG